MNKNGIASTFEDRLDALKESVRGIVDFSADKADFLKHKLGDVKDYSGAGVKKVGALIKEHPIAALAIAFGVGYLTMRMMRR